MKSLPIRLNSIWKDKGGKVWKVIEIKPFGHLWIFHKETARFGLVRHKDLRTGYEFIQEDVTNE